MHAGLAEEERDKFLREAFLALQDRLIKEWFTFGLYLDLSVTELNVLETNYVAHADKRTTVRQMLTKWKDKLGKKATWDKIVDALRKIGVNDLAQDLEDKHLFCPRYLSSFFVPRRINIGAQTSSVPHQYNVTFVCIHMSVPLYCTSLH